MFDFLTAAPEVTAIIGAVVLLILVAYLIVQRIHVAGPNEAYIVTGRSTRDQEDLSGQKVVTGASVFVLPFVQRLHSLDLSSRRIPVRIEGAVSQTGVKVDLDGVALVKVGGTEENIRAAAQRFLDQQDDIERFTQEVLAGSLRAIAGRLTVESIIKDRAAFASEVAEEAETSLSNQGLILDTFQIQDIQAEGSYLDDLGRPEAARVEQDAKIAEARAREAAEKQRYASEEEIANSERQLELRKAEIKAETDEANAQAAASGPLREAARNQEVISEQERVAEREASLRDRQLDAEVRKPADAERYRIEQEAEGAKNSQIFEAEAEKARRVRMAEAVEEEGRAEASATRARGEAEAQARRQNAEAFQLYGDAAVLDMLTSVLPEIVRGAAEPISAVDKLTVIDTQGASGLTRNVASNLEQGLQIGSDLTGLDLRSVLGGRGQQPARPGAADGDGAASDDTAGDQPADTAERAGTAEHAATETSADRAGEDHDEDAGR